MDYKNLEMLSWLVRQFREAGKTGISFDELIDKLYNEPSLDKNLSRRTFHNYLTELRNRFGIKIECDKYLEHEARKTALSEENRRYLYRLKEAPTNNDTPWTMPYLWALEISASMRILQDSVDDMKYVYIDNNPTGSENVNVILNAIRQQKCINFRCFHPEEGYYYPHNDFEPRGLVLKDHIWYLLGTSNAFNYILPLSYISQIETTEICYRPRSGFSPQKFWENNIKQQHYPVRKKDDYRW